MKNQNQRPWYARVRPISGIKNLLARRRKAKRTKEASRFLDQFTKTTTVEEILGHLRSEAEFLQSLKTNQEEMIREIRTAILKPTQKNLQAAAHHGQAALHQLKNFLRLRKQLEKYWSSQQIVNGPDPQIQGRLEQNSRQIRELERFERLLQTELDAFKEI